MGDPHVEEQEVEEVLLQLSAPEQSRTTGMRNPSWKISVIPPAMLPGAIPPMSAWWAMLQMKPTRVPSLKTGRARFTSGRWVPPAT